EPWRHFIPLRKDFGNRDDVVRAVQDTAGLQHMVDRTYQEIARNPKYSYRAFIERFDTVIETELRDRAQNRNHRAGSLFNGWLAVLLGARAVWLGGVRGGLDVGSRIYGTVVPASVRARLRPLMRRLVPRGSVG